MFKNIWKNKKFLLVNILIQGKIFDNYKELLSKLSRLNDFIIKKTSLRRNWLRPLLPYLIMKFINHHSYKWVFAEAFLHALQVF